MGRSMSSPAVPQIGQGGGGGGGAENLLDMDFDGAAPAALTKTSAMGSSSGLAGLGLSDERVSSPLAGNVITASQQQMGGMEDLMGMFGNSGSAAFGDVTTGGGGAGLGLTGNELLDGFAGLDMASRTQPPPPLQQLSDANANSAGAGAGAGKKTNEDLLGMF